MSTIFARMSKDSFFRMGYIYQVAGNLNAAAECYVRSIENGPNPEAHTFLGWVLGMMGDTDRAIVECRKALKLDPEFGNAWNDIGVYHTQKAQFDKAIRCLKRACRSKNYDNREFPHYNLARIYAQKEMLGAATNALRSALGANPGFVPARQMLERLEKQIH